MTPAVPKLGVNSAGKDTPSVKRRHRRARSGGAKNVDGAGDGLYLFVSSPFGLCECRRYVHVFCRRLTDVCLPAVCVTLSYTMRGCVCEPAVSVC